MPLFGSKKHANENLTSSGQGTTGLGHSNPTYSGSGTGMQPGHNSDIGYAGQPGFQSGIAAHSMGGPMAAQMGGHGPLPTSQINNGPLPQAPGGNAQHTMGHNDRSHIPPTSQIDRSHGGLPRGSGGSSPGHSFSGKIESAIGAAVGSNSLKAKGDLKQQEANAIKMQGAELAEAERLEREALMRRERAVGHGNTGAHPINSSLGGGNRLGHGPTGATPFNDNL